jgi:hypothetical protein
MQRNLIAWRVVETTTVTVYPPECLVIVQVEKHSERVVASNILTDLPWAELTSLKIQTAARTCTYLD